MNPRSFTHAFVCQSVHQSIRQLGSQQPASQPVSQPASAIYVQAAVRSLVCSLVHPHTVTVSQTFKSSINRSISQSSQSYQCYHNQCVHVRCRSLALLPSLELRVFIHRSATRTFYSQHSLVVTRLSHVTRAISLWSLSQPILPQSHAVFLYI